MKCSDDMKHALFPLLILLFIRPAIAQKPAPGTYFNISYFGILGTHPGLKIGLQQPILTFNREKREKRLDQLLGAVNLVFYFHRRNQLGLGATAELGFRKRPFNGLNTEAWLGLGYLRTIIPNLVYDFDDQQPGTTRRWIGSGHLLKTASLGLGWNIKPTADPGFWMIKPTLMHLKPFNVGNTLNFALDAGYHFQ